MGRSARGLDAEPDSGGRQADKVRAWLDYSHKTASFSNASDEKPRRPRKMKKLVARVFGGRTMRGQKITAVVGSTRDPVTDRRDPSTPATPSSVEAELCSWWDEASASAGSTRSSSSHPSPSGSSPRTSNSFGACLAGGEPLWDQRTTDGYAQPVQESTGKWLQAWLETLKCHQRAAGQALALVLAMVAFALPFLVSLTHVFPLDGLFDLPNPWRSILGLGLFAAGILPQLALLAERRGYSRAGEGKSRYTSGFLSGKGQPQALAPSWSKENAFKLPYDFSKKPVTKSGQEKVTNSAGFFATSRTKGSASVTSAGKPIAATAEGLSAHAGPRIQTPRVDGSNLKSGNLTNEHWTWCNKWQQEAVTASRATAAGVGLGMLVGRASWHPPVWILLAVAASWLLLSLPCHLKQKGPFAWSGFYAVWQLKEHFDARLYSFL